METKLAGPGSEARVTGGYAGGAGPAPRLRHDPGARRAEHDLRPRLPGRARRRLDRGLAGDDQGRSRCTADRRLPGEPQPAALHRGARRRDPGAGDPRQRRPLHPRRRDRPDRPRPALLPDLPRAVAGRGQDADRRGFPRGAGRAARPRDRSASGSRPPSPSGWRRSSLSPATDRGLRSGPAGACPAGAPRAPCAAPRSSCGRSRRRRSPPAARRAARASARRGRAAGKRSGAHPLPEESR